MGKLKNIIKNNKITCFAVLTIFILILIKLVKISTVNEEMIFKLEKIVAEMDFISKLLNVLLLILASIIILRKIIDIVQINIYKKYDIEDELNYDDFLNSYIDIKKYKKSLNLLVLLTFLLVIVAVFKIFIDGVDYTQFEDIFIYLAIIILSYESVVSSKLDFYKNIVRIKDEDKLEFIKYLNNYNCNEYNKDNFENTSDLYEGNLTEEKIFLSEDEYKKIKDLLLLEDKTKFIKKINRLEKIRYIIIIFSVIIILLEINSLFKNWK